MSRQSTDCRFYFGCRGTNQVLKILTNLVMKFALSYNQADYVTYIYFLELTLYD